MPMVRITRDFDAPVDKVFRAHADPDLFVKWNGPNSLTSTIEQFDFRTGARTARQCDATGSKPASTDRSTTSAPTN